MAVDMVARGAGTPPDRAAEGRERRRYLLLLAPPALLLAFIFVYPVLGLLGQSVYKDEFTLRFYQQVFGEPVYLHVLWLTFRTAAIVTLLCLVLGYPLAYVLVGLPGRMQRLLLIVVVLPFFVSLIVRTYAWMVLLGRTGLVNETLQALSVVAEPLPLMYSTTGALIGMTYALLPFMVLTAYSVMRGIDGGLVRAAHSLGSSRWQAFRRIFLPLSMPGIAGGMILVFIMSLGFFITPRLMGGPSDLMIAMLIEHEVELTLNWPFAAALSTVLLVVTLVGFVAYSRLVRLERLFEAAR